MHTIPHLIGNRHAINCSLVSFFVPRLERWKTKKYEDDLVDFISQIESKDKKIKSLEGRKSELQDEKAKVNNLLKENKTGVDEMITWDYMIILKNGHIKSL